MTRFAFASLGAIALAGCSTVTTRPAMTPAEAPPPAAPAIPEPTGYFAQPSALQYGAPDFTRFTDADLRPAIEQGIAIKRAEIAAIAANPDAPTFDNTIVAMEKSGRMLSRAGSVLGSLTGANTNPVLDATDAAVSPQYAALNDAIYLDDKLFARVRTLHDNAASLGLDPAQAMLLQRTYDDFVRSGAQLSAADKETLKGYNQQLSNLTTQFSQLLTKGTNAASPAFDKAQLAGMSEGDLAAAAKAAEARGMAGKYVIPLQNTTQQPSLPTLDNRATRQALFDASWTRSVRGDQYDTRALIKQIVGLRAQKAALLGYPDWATLTLQDRMVKTPAEALGFMQQMVPALAAKQKAEAADLNAFIRKSGGNFTVTPADWDYYSERLKKQRYAIDDATVKPYFELTNVLENGVFKAANGLYGLTFKRRTDLPTYSPDVRTYEVFDADGSSLALFYLDPWKRDNKRGGAWMSSFSTNSDLLGTRPVVYNVENFAKPAPGQPELLGWDDVTTLFHEFGHALHGMFFKANYPGLAGTARDFVEFPSQFNENWATEPSVFASYARHYKTGAPMPAALVAKIRESANFNQGYALGETMEAALLDMKWHALKAGEPVPEVNAFEAAALNATGLQVQTVPPRYRTSYFRHIMSGGYAAGYYAYIWTEMLDHDAFAWFTANGGLTRANGQRFRDMVLSKGSSLDYATMYRAFAGHDPQVGPMLEARGLAPAKK
ncbi:M3 family metallopeptidase [Parablastomonas sp. CN1-191]|uniref:M3 family metallopeptidase n=1 Tax=Parablastomonas sp. CN1-191 TaxID=3400908 RepID=UPI003BF8F81B